MIVYGSVHDSACSVCVILNTAVSGCPRFNVHMSCQIDYSVILGTHMEYCVETRRQCMLVRACMCVCVRMCVGNTAFQSKVK